MCAENEAAVAKRKEEEEEKEEEEKEEGIDVRAAIVRGEALHVRRRRRHACIVRLGGR
jgi:hypothetical protein